MPGRDIRVACRRAGMDVVGVEQGELDLADFRSLQARLPETDWVVNAMQYLDLDGAEQQRERAFAINTNGARMVGQWCARHGARLLQLSSAYVFDGRAKPPYGELSKPSPVNVVGASLLAGEKSVRTAGCDVLIARVGPLFTVDAPCFALGMMRDIASGRRVQAAIDQMISPTYSVHFAAACVRLLECERFGVVHVAAEGMCSVYNFACQLADQMHVRADVEALPLREMTLVANRPPNSVMDTRRYRMWTGYAMPSWEEGLEDFLLAQAETIKDSAAE
jgi:dTDP-4-dehydrorhamnose reductase